MRRAVTGSGTSRRGSNRIIVTGAALAALALAGAGTLLAQPAVAATGAPRTGALPAAAPCLAPTSGRQAPRFHRGADTPAVTAADLAALPAQQPADLPHVTRKAATQPAPVHRSDRDSPVILPAHVRIPVVFHVIRGTRPGEQPHAGPLVLRSWVQHLNGGFHGDQSPTAASTRYTFALRHVDYHTSERWWHARIFDAADREMMRQLHRGGSHVLNVYVNGGGPDDLGWSHFPWQYSAHPELDGVSITRKSMPGGSARGYNRGDTLIHETGHWMGLLHTFQGGCSGGGDLVADTPAEAYPSFFCEVGRDTCPQPGTDPVHNFMDYSLDSCMDEFTAGQAVRMDLAYLRWRAR